MSRTVACAVTLLMIPMLLSGCGQSSSDRAVSGAGLGAVAGTAGAALVGGNPLTGAAIGAAAGAVTGASTNDGDINFGKPLWR